MLKRLTRGAVGLVACVSTVILTVASKLIIDAVAVLATKLVLVASLDRR